MFKRVFAYFILFLMLGQVALAQNYSFDPNDPVFLQRVQEKNLRTQQFLDLYNVNPNAAYQLLRQGQGNAAYVTGPEQDCANATPVCSNSYTQPNSYQGYGSTVDVSPSTTCLLSGETNSTWYIFTTQSSGVFTFMLNTQQDYDFIMYNITGTSCSSIPSLTPVRCNYSAQYGNTGLQNSGNTSAASISVDASGSPYMPGVQVTAGQTYVLMINNYTGNSTGYSLTFGGVSIADVTPPTLLSPVNVSCNSRSITLRFSENINCSTVSPADFSFTGPSPISVSSISGCTSAFSNSITLNLNVGILTPGLYTLNIAAGSILDVCNNGILAASEPFTLVADAIITGNSTTCTGGSVTLTADPAGGTYLWNNGQTTRTITVSPVVTTTYRVEVTIGACVRADTHLVVVYPGVSVIVNPDSAVVCGAGTMTVTASALLGSSPCATCTYSWAPGGQTTPVVNLGPGTYTVTVSDVSNGCPSASAVTKLVTVSGNPPPACNNIYVTTTGTGDGLSPSNPTTLVAALQRAQCSNVTIKVAVGDYNISAPLVMGSYTTLEGGFSTDFLTKTSSMATAGAFPNRGTRIIRSTALDPGSPAASVGNSNNPRVTAISVTSGSQYFRIQDIRIEMPNNHTAGTRITNYGIYLGSGCSSYNIVRCWVDAGKGADGVSGTVGTSGGSAIAAMNGTNGQNQGRTAGTGGAGGAVGANGGNGGMGGASGNNMGSNGVSGGGGGIVGTLQPGAGGQGGNVACDGNIGCGDPGGCSTNTCGNGARGKNGVTGSNGIDGADGANGLSPTYAAGYFMPGSNGLPGADAVSDGIGGGGGGGGGGEISSCLIFSTTDPGSGGGGGGAGGKKALTAGQGATSGGGAFAIFSVSSGAGANVIDCNLFATAGASAVGGAGGAGQPGGIGGTGGTPCDGGRGGNGGNGGRGGNSGNGGNAQGGSTGLKVDLVGVTLTTLPHTNLQLDQQQLVTTTNINCTVRNQTLTTNNASPSWLSLGIDASPANPNVTSTPITTQYSSVGRKSLSLGNGTRTTTQPYPIKWFSSDNAAAVPINDNALSTTNLTVSGYTDNGGNVPAAGVFINAQINHTYIGDVELYLQAPNGKILKLVENKGGAGAGMWSGFNGTVWTDAAGAAMPPAPPSTSIDFRPDGSLTVGSAGIVPTISNFAALGGSPANGVWKLLAYDDASGDVGSVLWWEISFGGYINATDYAIPDGSPNAGVTSNITVSGMPTTLSNAQNMVVHLDLTHTWDADVDLYLTAPNGSTLRLSTDNGGSDDDYGGTRFTDAATINIIAYTAPFRGYLRPEGGLGTENGITPNISTFSALNGSNPNGTWSLKVFDDSGADTGILRFWAIDFADETKTTSTTSVTDNYTDFVDIATTPTTLNPTIISVHDTICPNTTGLYVSGIRTGVSYEWKIISLPSNTIIATGTNDSLSYNFTTSGDYIVRSIVTSICCATKDSVSYNVHVIDNSVPPVIVQTPVSPICNGASIVLSVPTLPTTFSYSWSTGDLTPTVTLNPTSTTTVTLNVVTDKGCPLPQASTTITIFPIPQVDSITGNPVVCAGMGQVVTLTAHASAPGSTFLWTGPGGFSSTANPASFTPTATNFYYVRVTGPAPTNCPGELDSILISVLPQPIPTISGAGAICAGDSITLVGGGGKPGQYEWSLTSGGAIFATTDSIRVSPSSTQTYYLVAAFDDCKSQTPAQATVTVNPKPAVSLSASTTTICVGDQVTFTATNTSSATISTYDFIVNGTVVQSSASTTYSTTALTNGSVVSVIAHSNLSCLSDTSNKVTISVNPAPTTPTAGNNSPLCIGATLNLTSSTVAGASYSWTGPNGFSSNL
ncbi:MAG: proprotein convertase P-domain-containing protein, partial [Bacteroidia bacterium]|nr:proprotein convertase P-domain-containing protein [Bacteroidia bacterium]